MKIAVSTDNGMVSAHFGRCPEFSIFTIENNEIINKEVKENPGHVPGKIPEFLNNLGAGVIIAGGMGYKAQQILADMNIIPVMGVEGPVDEIVKLFVEGSLVSGESMCQPKAGKGYGLDKEVCDH